MSESQTPVEDPRCRQDRQTEIQSSLVREDSQRIMADLADQQRLQISDLHLDKFHHASNVCLLKDKIQGMHLFTIFYGSYAMDQRSGDG